MTPLNRLARPTCVGRQACSASLDVSPAHMCRRASLVYLGCGACLTHLGHRARSARLGSRAHLGCWARPTYLCR